MTRVNVEENAFGDSRLARLERLMNWDRRTAMGCLVVLWHDSQALLRVDGTAEEIATWAWCFNEDEGKRLVAALETVGYLTLLDNGKYLIHGNETQLDNIVAVANRAKKGGEATRAKWAATKAERKGIKPARRQPVEGLKPATSLLQAGLEPTPSVPQAGSEQAPGRLQLGSMQCNAVQGNAEHLFPETTSPPAPRPGGSVSDGSKLWEPFRQAYQARYKHEPDRNRKVNSQLKTLAERLGVENGAAVLRFFYASEEKWLVDRCHPLGKLVAEAEAWRAKMVTAKASRERSNPILTVEDIRAGR